MGIALEGLESHNHFLFWTSSTNLIVCIPASHTHNGPLNPVAVDPEGPLNPVAVDPEGPLNPVAVDPEFRKEGFTGSDPLV